MYKAFNQMIEKISKDIEINPSDATLYYKRGLYYFKLDDFYKALKDFNKAIELNPKYAEAYSKRGLTKYYLLRIFYLSPSSLKFERKKNKFSKLLNFNNISKINTKEKNKFRIYQHELDNELEDLNKAIELEKNNEYLFLNRGIYFFLNRKYKKAFEDFDFAFKINSKNINIALEIIQYFKMLNLYDDIFDLLKKLIKDFTDNKRLYYELGEVYLEKDNFKEALNYFNKALILDNKYSLAYYGLSKTFLKMEKYDKALDKINYAIQLEENNLNFLATRLIINYSSNNFKNVINDYEEIMKLNPKFQNIEKDLLRNISKLNLYLYINKYLRIFFYSAYSYIKLNNEKKSLKAINIFITLERLFIELEKKLFGKIITLYNKKTNKKNIISISYNTYYNTIEKITKKPFKEIIFLPFRLERYYFDYSKIFMEKNCSISYMYNVLKLVTNINDLDILYKKLTYIMPKKEFMDFGIFFYEFSSYEDYKIWAKKVIERKDDIALLKHKLYLLNKFRTYYEQVKSVKSKNEFDDSYDADDEEEKIYEFDFMEFFYKINDKLLEKYEEELDKKYQKIKELNEKLQNIIQQYTHTLANTIFPNTIYEVAQKLKKHTTYKKEAMLLSDAYHAEVFIKHQGQLLAIRNSTNPKTFQSYIRGDRLEQEVKTGFVTISSIIKKSLERVLSRFFNEDYHKLDRIRKILSEKHKIEFCSWKDKFEKEVFFDEKDILKWTNDNFEKVKITLNDEWENIKLKKDKYAESLLQGYFGELFFNALKYRDHYSNYWIEMDFNSRIIDNEKFLIARFKNLYLKEQNKSISSKKGLMAIKNDLEMLNEEKDDNKTLKIIQNDKDFIVELIFKNDLFLLPKKENINYQNLFKKKGV